MLVLYIVGFPQVAHVMCLPILLAFVCALSQTSHLFPMPGLSRQGVCSRWYPPENFKLGNLQPLFRWSDFWENLKSSLGKVCFYLGKVWNFLWDFWCDFVEKFCCWENLELVNLNVNFKIFVGKSWWEYPCPSELGDFVCHVGSVFEKMFLWANLLGTLVKFWNFNLGKLLLGILGNPLRIPSWEHLVNFGKISIWENFVKFGILFGKILLLSMFVEQNFGKFYLGNFSPCWQCFDLGVFAWENLFKILLWKTLFSSDQHGGLTDGQLRGRIVRKSPCL